jgi:hypothetical protein
MPIWSENDVETEWFDNFYFESWFEEVREFI